MKKNPDGDLFEPNEFKRLRQIYSRRFEKDLCSKMNPFHELYSFIRNKRDYQDIQEQKYTEQKFRQKSEAAKVFEAE